jgi:hypothetical protein
MGLRKLSVQPKHHAQAEGAIAGFKKTSPPRWQRIAQDQGLKPEDLEICYADEARIGQKNKITRRWARRGTRPIVPQDQRYASTYIFGAVCPQQGKGAALVLPYCNTEAMSLHLAEIAAMVRPGRHAVLLLDQAAWHLSTALRAWILVVKPPRERPRAWF